MVDFPLVIAITTEGRPGSRSLPGCDTADEAAQISYLLDNGCLSRVHLRKPSWGAAEVEALVRAIPSRLRSRLSVHGRRDLASEYGMGLHLPSAATANDAVLAREMGIKTVSASCHSLNDCLRMSAYTDYRFLSPVFDSISKKGYRAAFDPDELGRKLMSDSAYKGIMALGGITPGLFPEVKRLGFDGAAMLGYVWNNEFEDYVAIYNS